jgi:two-component system sensor histidine kinase UhpB
MLLSDDPAEPEGGAWLTRAASVGYPDQIGRLFQRYPVSSPLPASDVVRTGEAVWLESAAAYRARYPQLTEVINSTDYEAAAAVPLRYAGRMIGVLALSFPGVLNFTSEIQNYIFTLASYCAHALERAKLYEETQRLNSELEARVSERTAQLEQSLEQLHDLAARLHSAREEERRMLARELHDELGATLTGLKMSVANIQRNGLAQADGLATELAGLSATIDGAVRWVRRIATDLRPGVLDDLGLLAAIEWLAQDFEAKSGIECSLVLDVAEVELETERAMAVFRVVQESLTNIARHAHATSVLITVEEQHGRLAVRVEDNGQGFDASAGPVRSLGLVGMRERVNTAAGELVIQSTPGQGTTVSVTIPLRP